MFLFIILVISRLGFEGLSWVLIVSVPDLCILFYFYSTDIRVYCPEFGY